MKSQNISCLLIDPFEKTVTPVYYDGELSSLYHLLDCRCVTVAPCGKRYDLFVDDEGLFVKGQKFFATVDFPQPLGGKALAVGVDADGNTIPPDITLEELEARILWVEGVIWEEEEGCGYGLITDPHEMVKALTRPCGDE